MKVLTIPTDPSASIAELELCRAHIHRALNDYLNHLSSRLHESDLDRVRTHGIEKARRIMSRTIRRRIRQLRRLADATEVV